MKAFNDFLLIVRDSSIDSNDKMMSLFKIVDRFEFQLSPDMYKPVKDKKTEDITTITVPYAIASAWRLEENVKKDFTVHAVVKFIDPKGKELGSSPYDATFNAGVKRIKSSAATTQLPYTTNGEYTIKMTLVDKHTNKELAAASTTFEVYVSELNT